MLPMIITNALSCRWLITNAIGSGKDGITNALGSGGDGITNALGSPERITKTTTKRQLESQSPRHLIWGIGNILSSWDVDVVKNTTLDLKSFRIRELGRC